MSAPYQVLQPLPAEQRAALKADIEAHGLQVAVVYDELGNVIDGHTRDEIARELGMTDWPRVIRNGLSDEQKVDLAYALNLQRRHMTGDERREAIAAYLRRYPRKSDRQIAVSIGVDHKTVSVVRKDLDARGEIPHVDTRTDAQGRQQPVPKVSPKAVGKRVGKQISRVEASGHRDLVTAVREERITAAEAERYLALSLKTQKRLASEADPTRRQRMAVVSSTLSRVQKARAVRHEPSAEEPQEVAAKAMARRSEFLVGFTNALQQVANYLAFYHHLKSEDEIVDAVLAVIDLDDIPLMQQFDVLAPFVHALARVEQHRRQRMVVDAAQ